MLFLGTACYFISRQVLLQSVLQIERASIDKNIDRVRSIFQNEILRLKVTALDWGNWDDTYNFALTKNSRYIQSNLLDDTFENNKWAAFIIVNNQIRVVYSKAVDEQYKAAKPFSTTELQRYFYPGSILFNQKKYTDTKGGYALFNNQLQFVAVSTIKPSDHSGLGIGYLILMRSLTGSYLKDFSDSLKLPLTINYLNYNSSLPADLLERNESVIINKEIRVSLLLRDIEQKPIAVIKFIMQRDIYQYSLESINFFLLLLFIISIIVLSTLGLIIYTIIIKRIEEFNKQITTISELKNYSQRINISGHDELNSMSNQVNALLKVIEASHHALEERILTIGKINKELQKLEAENRHIIANAPEPIIITDSQSTIKLINNAAELTFHCSLDDMRNQKIDDVLQLKIIDKHGKEKLGKMSESFFEEAKELIVSYKDKSMPIELKASRHDKNTIYILRDITERKKHEQELMNLNQKLVMLSREAGRAEVSTMLLHNIGNMLNTILVTLTLLQDELSKSKLNNLEKIGALLQEHEHDLPSFLTEDQKGKKLPIYIVGLANLWPTERVKIIEQLRTMNISIDEIILVIKHSQHNAVSIVEVINIAELIDEVIKNHTNELQKFNITIKRNFSKVPLAYQDRFKILSILHNLVANAIEALTQREQALRFIEFKIESKDNQVLIKVIDNGIGIDPKNLISIFLFRFTTKPDGKGMGLHSSSILAQEIGATLTAYSAGIGQGTTLTLTLPIKIPERAHRSKI
ncbi:CHASE4 domain-containing protein [Legionella beliardensis]|uniref:CHASE4 domain-containing protein n=1 Tax=Legionella beliardensis TaxID=91822 RepID=UPI0013EF9164|nr:CHASE4 domain-containing protein [Legionella beliardensis]